MPRDWQTLLHSTIPLARAMQVSAAAEADGRQRLQVPLAPNVNDKGTAFGGSLATLATLAGWVETQRRLDEAGVVAAVEIVIQHGETDYLLPAAGDFSAVPLPIEAEAVERFVRQFERRGVARLVVAVELHCADEVVARFRGDYVAVRARET
ncbi:YiiD C-terminal domain-containing protein [Chitinimonas koreensis]|uniref:YiiD C-terminal domain-containing protein n=1 Tax=Chitinimonas koreensis TaxID=356302 RepID=UPI0004294DEB|nr:YiiD C-terminal domain-containing protein [Chitinimonas koreensis]QNM95415.1 YiiD C-terminal domain-containing protein [Chitinimonas koreensis]